MEALAAATFGTIDDDDDDGQHYGMIVEQHPPFFLSSHADSFSVPISALVKKDLCYLLDSF